MNTGIFGRMISDRGSIAPLCIGAGFFAVALTLVCVSGTQVNHQQQQLQTHADSLALDLADLLRYNAVKVAVDPTYVAPPVESVAQGELDALWPAATIQYANLDWVRQVGKDRVNLRICQGNMLAQTPVIGGLVGVQQVCAVASAKTTLP